jgi:hypothetical protein
LHYFCQKIGWATFLQTRLVTLAAANARMLLLFGCQRWEISHLVLRTASASVQLTNVYCQHLVS